MSSLWVIFALVFGAALFGVQAIYWIFFRARQKQTLINRRLALNSELGNPAAVLEALRRERGFSDFGSPLLTQMSDYLVQTGLQIERDAFMLYVAALAIVFLLVFSLLLGFGFSSTFLALVMAAGATFLYLRRVRRKRIARFSEQLPDALDVIVRGVKVGHPFSTALNLVAKEMSDPIGTEFGMTSDEISFGLDVNTAIENLSRRVGQEDLLFFMTAINVQSRTGGNLAEILERLAQLIRQRANIRLKIKSLTAEGRLSAVFLTAMPFILFGAINLIAPTYYGEVRNHPAAVPVLIFALAMLLVGNAIIRKMVNFRV